MPDLYFFLFHTVGRGLSPVDFVGDFMASNRCLVIISAAIPQSSSARGSSKPLPYNVKIGFHYESNFTKSGCIFMRVVYLAL